MGNTSSILFTQAGQNALGDTELARDRHGESNTSCTFLDKIPLEVRRHVYKYLLVNPLLGQSEEDLRYYSHEGRKYIEFDLSPSILRVCHQIHTEASDVLYGSKQFYIYCFPLEHAWWNRQNECPLLRYYDRDYDSYNPPPRLMDTAAALKVRHWKILISSRSGGNGEKYRGGKLVEACKLMHTSQPLHLLRFEEGQFTIEDAEFHEVYAEIQNLATVPTYVSQTSSDSSQAALIELIHSNRPVEQSLPMYSALLDYGRSFERHGPYKAEMGLAYDEGIDKGVDRPIDPRYQRLGLRNPYRWLCNTLENSHPVEEALAQAKIAAELGNTVVFKERRAEVLEYLEPQNQRIMTAAATIRQFINEKRTSPIFQFDDDSCSCCSYHEQYDSTRHMDTDAIAEGIIYLEQYAVAVRRDSPINVQKDIKKQQREFDNHCFHPKREELLLKMNRDFGMQQYEDFGECLKRAFEHMEQQRLEIQNARKALFQFDVANDRQFVIDFAGEECDDLVGWGSDEENEDEDE